MTITMTVEARQDLYVAAKTEWAAVKEWRAAGSIGEAPATPNLDRLNQAHASGGIITMSKTTTITSNDPSTRAPKGTVIFWHDGVAMPAGANTIAHLAVRFTKGCLDGGKHNSETLRRLLAANGITEPTTTEWSYLLPNGVTIGASHTAAAIPTFDAKPKKARKAAPVWSVEREGERTYIATRDGEAVQTFRSRKAALQFIENEAGAKAAVKAAA